MTTRDRDKEALSALMDGESRELELRRALDLIEGDDALRAWWRVSAAVKPELISQLGFARRWPASLSCNAILYGAWRLLPRSRWPW
jgi:hypothetical protein